MAAALKPPLQSADVEALRIGDPVLISGTIFTARDAAHRRLIELIEQGRELPVDLAGQVIYYTGPTPPAPGRPTGSAGPTTSSRMDAYTPPLLKATGIRALIGKGERSPEVVESLRENGVIYLAAVGGAGALLAEAVTAAEPLAWPELGTEAMFRFAVVEFPAIVVIDLHGGNLYESGRARFLRPRTGCRKPGILPHP